MNLNVFLPVVLRFEGQDIQLLYLVICDGYAAYGHTISMDEYGSARIFIRAQFPIGLIRIIYPQREVKVALGIELIDRIEALRHLKVSLFSFRPRRTR